ncbi:hypothetical protein DFQ27_006254 [Actinomortierella ambigua]|uniref:Lysosomal dipeptide transporter MFSD1 n=1 Tax=Actinomortierella ambigua TaxID=1343610 RepID=A0A9P6UC77_9FUNG|nr:hypothetical protein DFQ27_006254 [Actinomortierella ambigua]
MAAHVYQPLKEDPPLGEGSTSPVATTTDPFRTGQRDLVSRIDAADASRLLHPESHYDDDDHDNRVDTIPSRRGRSQGSANKKEREKSTAAWAAFFTAALLGVSTHFTAHTVGPLKDVLKDHMGITNTQFSLLQSSLTLFPTVVPLIGGLLVERYGTGPSSIVFSTVVVLAQVVVVLGCWVRSVKVMIIGFCLFGIGAGPITIIQETMWVRYFKNKSLALVLALGLTTGKLAGFLALAGAYPLSTLPPFGFVTPFLVSLIIACVAWVMNILFLFMVKKPDEDARTVARITILLKAKRTSIGWREVYSFSSMFWTLLTMSFLFGASWNPFMHQASSIVKHRYDLSDKVAAWDASITLAVPLIVYPFLGTFIDSVGKRAWLLLVTALLLIGTHLLILIPYNVIPVLPSIPMLLFALSLAIGTLSIVTTMPILTRHVPTGLGLHRSIDNIGATLVGTLAGMMQDFGRSDNDGDDSRSITQQIEDALEKWYHHIFPAVEKTLETQDREEMRILGMFLTVAILAAIAASIFVWGDRHWTDGENGNTATGLVNAVYKRGRPQPADADEEGEEEEDDDDDDDSDADGFDRRGSNGRWQRQRRRQQQQQRQSPGRRRKTRRSHDILEAMMGEPIFDLEDEPDAEEVSMIELSQQHPPALTTTLSASGRKESIEQQHLSFARTQSGPSQRQARRHSNAAEDIQSEDEDIEDANEDEDDEEEDVDVTGPMLPGYRAGFEELERRYSVRIDNGEHAKVDPAKRRQAHFWIMFWTSLLVTSWTVFGIGMMMR